MENKVLGKGLSALISQNKYDNVQTGKLTGDQNVTTMDVGLIKNNALQPRQNYDKSKLDELKTSIKEKGILQPILVRPSGSGYEVIAGERRLRAARDLGLKQVPVVVRNVTDNEALVLALVENIQRHELNGIEEAIAFKRLIEEFHFTQESVAQAVGKDRSTITNLLRLLKLPKEIQGLVAEDKISVGHARALLSIEDTKQQIQLANDVVKKGLSVRQIEAQVGDNLKASGKKQPAKGLHKSRDIQILEEDLSRALGTKVLVEDKNNKGKVIIEYYSLDDLDRILGAIKR